MRYKRLYQQQRARDDVSFGILERPKRERGKTELTIVEFLLDLIQGNGLLNLVVIFWDLNWIREFKKVFMEESIVAEIAKKRRACEGEDRVSSVRSHIRRHHMPAIEGRLTWPDPVAA